jgi:hypothetical protein
MRREGNQLLLGERNCYCNHPSAPCPAGRIAGDKPCETCQGAGKGKRGGDRGCKVCYGFGTRPDFINHVQCGDCQGTGIVPETEYDHMTHDMWKGLDFRVYRVERAQTWNEQYLAWGYAWSSTDYGRAWQMTDEAIIVMVKEAGRSVQACHVVREGLFCDFVAIVVGPYGYTVQGVFAADQRDVTIDRKTAEVLGR